MPDTLETILNKHGVFPDEKEVWLMLGFYVCAGRVEAEGYSSKSEFYFDDRMIHIPYEAGTAIRQGLIKSLAKRIPISPPGVLDDLEVERG